MLIKMKFLTSFSYLNACTTIIRDTITQSIHLHGLILFSYGPHILLAKNDNVHS